MTVEANERRVVLLTGVTGFVGKVVLEELLRRREELGVAHVFVLLRASDSERADARFRVEVVASRCFADHAPGWEKRVETITGDLTLPALGLTAATRERVAKEVTHVIHCAASVEFNLPLEEATAVNIGGALGALDVASACGRLESFVDVSTAYVTAHPKPFGGGVLEVEEKLAPLPRDAASIFADILDGRVREGRLLAETGHPNTYTLTKCVAEHLVAQAGESLPVTLVRPSIVSVSERAPSTGWIDSAAAFAGFVVLLGSGRLRVVSGNPAARLDIVPCDAVAHRIVEAAFAPPPRGKLRILHAVAGLPSALPIQLCRERITKYFEQNPVRGPGVDIRYVGPPGPRARIAQTLHHELPGILDAALATLARKPNQARAARALADLQRQTNRDFTYFANATFDFATSVPIDPPVDPAEYIDTVCEGVSQNLLRRRRKRKPR